MRQQEGRGLVTMHLELVALGREGASVSLVFDVLSNSLATNKQPQSHARARLSLFRCRTQSQAFSVRAPTMLIARGEGGHTLLWPN